MKRSIFLAVLFLAAFLAFSCAKTTVSEPDKDAVNETSDDTQSGEENGTNGEEETDISSAWNDAGEEVKTDEWKDAYADKLFEVHRENPEARFSLGYLNDDDVPELFIYEGWYHQAQVSIYHYSDDKAENIGADGYSFGSWGSLAYKEREGIIISNYSGMGISDTGIFEWDGENVRNIVSFSDYSGMGDDFTEGAMYTIDSEEVTEDEFYARFDEMTENDVFVQYDDAYEIDDYNIAYYVYGFGS